MFYDQIISEREWVILLEENKAVKKVLFLLTFKILKLQFLTKVFSRYLKFVTICRCMKEEVGPYTILLSNKIFFLILKELM